MAKTASAAARFAQKKRAQAKAGRDKLVDCAHEVPTLFR